MGDAERCPACGDESASPPAEVFCVRCATEDPAITDQRMRVAEAVAALQEIADIEGDQGPGRIAADALRAMGIDPYPVEGQ